MNRLIVAISGALLSITTAVWAQKCVECHKKTTPSIVSDWQLSQHSKNAVDCSVRHGDGHTSATDVAKALIPTPETCNQCHSVNFAKGELAKGDDIIRQADRLMAEAIETVAGLYKDSLLAKPKAYAYAYPDLLTFHDAPTPIEQRLFVMYLEHRMRTFQGAFHANPDYALWYGWSEMQRDLTEIRYMAREMRRSTVDRIGNLVIS